MRGTEKFIKQICKQIEISVNRSIKSFPDAIWLSELFTKKKLPISASTFARLYGITTPISKPYLSTLDNLAKFLNYYNWENYVEDQTQHHFSSNYFLTEVGDGFSQSVLEMALCLKNYELVQTQLERYPYFEDNPVHFSTANLIGKYVRMHRYEDTLLQVLASTIAGQSLFYECFVDEDNENNNFSKAMLNHYLPKVPDFDTAFFVYSYIVAQGIYAGTIEKNMIIKYQKLLKETKVDDLHYHLLSRYFECSILLEGIEDKLTDTVQNYLDNIVHYASIKEKNEWLLARNIRAILHFGFKKELLNHTKFNELINETVMQKRQNKKSAALYILQLYWLYSSKQDTGSYQPFHLSIDYLQGNSKERIAIETATASLYAEGKLQKQLEENLKRYCAEAKLKWILNLLYN